MKKGKKQPANPFAKLLVKLITVGIEPTSPRHSRGILTEVSQIYGTFSLLTPKGESFFDYKSGNKEQQAASAGICVTGEVTLTNGIFIPDCVRFRYKKNNEQQVEGNR